MKPDLLEILVCPEDKASLALQNEVLDGDDIVSGSLVCSECGFAYPIEQGIPNLLPQKFHQDGVTDAK